MVGCEEHNNVGQPSISARLSSKQSLTASHRLSSGTVGRRKISCPPWLKLSRPHPQPSLSGAVSARDTPESTRTPAGFSPRTLTPEGFQKRVGEEGGGGGGEGERSFDLTLATLDVVL